MLAASAPSRSFPLGDALSPMLTTLQTVICGALQGVLPPAQIRVRTHQAKAIDEFVTLSTSTRSFDRRMNTREVRQLRAARITLKSVPHEYALYTLT